MADGKASESTHLVMDAPTSSSRTESTRYRSKGGVFSRQIWVVGAVLLIAAVVVTAVLLTQGNDETNASSRAARFADSVTSDDIFVHLEKLFDISQRYNNTRSAVRGGYNESVDYVVSQLAVAADYFTVQIQPFTITNFQEVAPPVLNLINGVCACVLVCAFVCAWICVCICVCVCAFLLEARN